MNIDELGLKVWRGQEEMGDPRTGNQVITDFSRALIAEYEKAAADEPVDLDKYFSQKGQLALAQADNQRLREFAQKISEQIPEKPDYWSSCGQCSNNADEAEDLIAQSQDVSALEAIVQKAGEVMRERCIHTCRDYGLVGNAIRALPDVTLEDLK